jgi:hypothetical protein
MMHGGDRNRRGLDLAMRGYKLFDRTKSSTAEFAGRSIGSCRIRIHNTNQLDWYAFFSQLLVHASMIAPEGARANDGNVNRVVCGQVLLSCVAESRLEHKCERQTTGPGENGPAR